MEITAAVGVYYWTGFLGGVMLTSYQIRLLVKGPQPGDIIGCTVGKVKRQMIYIIMALFVGTATLCLQAMYPTWVVHTVCRFFQGLAGAYIFFYAFLLSVELFKGAQQVFALTCVSCALNVAEVLGSGLGAAIYDGYGHETVFYSLAITSTINQVMLIFVLILVCTKAPSDAEEARRREKLDDEAGTPAVKHGMDELWALLRRPALRQSVLLVTTAATVKGAVEEALPLHADHEWNFEPLRIGQAFTIVAFCYIFSAIFMGRCWSSLGSYRLHHCGTWLALLGIACWAVFSVCYFQYGESSLFFTLALYGTCLGMCHTPAALLIAEAIEEGGDGPAGDVANGIWNTMWEAGGSVGFLMGGLLSHSYFSQLRLMGGVCVVCLISASTFFTAGNKEVQKSMQNDMKDIGALTYGSAS